MFENPFSFEGRIRRLEYGLSSLLTAFAIGIISTICVAAAESTDGGSMVLFIFLCIPIYWFSFAQNAKRCHDLGNSGWWQLIPFYGFLLLFQEGQTGANRYGEDPKNRKTIAQNTSSTQTNTSYSTTMSTGSGYGNGNYSGGHNNHQNNGTFGNHNQNNPTNEEYQNGNLYN